MRRSSRGRATTFFTPVAVALSTVVVVGVADATIKELSNDGFDGLGSVTCQVGFAAGEVAAAKLTAQPGDYPYQIRKIRMFVCPASTSGFVVLRLSEDNSGTVAPGPILYEEVVSVTGSDAALNEVDLTTSNIIVSGGSVRVELEWFQNGPPGVANDSDGIVPNVNYVYADLGGGLYQWFFAEQLGVPGDWIVRMEIETAASDEIFADGFESGDTIAWSATVPSE